VIIRFYFRSSFPAASTAFFKTINFAGDDAISKRVVPAARVPVKRFNFKKSYLQQEWQQIPSVYSNHIIHPPFTPDPMNQSRTNDKAETDDPCREGSSVTASSSNTSNVSSKTSNVSTKASNDENPAIPSTSTAAGSNDTASQVYTLPSIEPHQTRVMRTLTNGRKDLWNSHYPIHGIGLLFNPYRDFVLDPLFAIGTILLPPLVAYTNSPYVDHILSHVLSISIFCMKSVYRPIVMEEHMNLRDTAKQDFMITTKAAYHLPKYHPPSDIVSAFRGAVAFTLSVSADIISLLVDNKKMIKWMETLTELKSYLDASGVSSELDESIMKPLYSGRLLDNLKILSDIQGKLYHNRHVEVAQTTNIDELKDPILIGHRMMRYATSAYGTEMIRSALDREVSVHEFLGHDDNYQVHKAIAFHSGISDVNDIRILEVNDGGDMHLLRHFVAIDRTSKSVVLAIRGTLSVSGALVDMTAMDGTFFLAE
jgi:hypothetical protein